MEETKKLKTQSWSFVFWTFLISIGYAVLRYHILGNVPWNQLPFFILNKGFGLSAFILLAFNFVFGPLKSLGVPIPNSWLRSRRIMGIVGFIQAFTHVFISFLLFNTNVYGKFFDQNGIMTLDAGLSMLGGVLAFIFLWIYNVSFSSNFRKDKDLISFITSRTVLLVAMFLAGSHIFFMGYTGWLNFSGWLGGLPPISLVAFVVFVVGYSINLFGRE
jgi:hypothetical protein